MATENDKSKNNDNLQINPPQPTNYEKILSINKLMTPCDTIEEKDIEVGPNSCGIRA
jgi:hypothetical protein